VQFLRRPQRHNETRSSCMKRLRGQAGRTCREGPAGRTCTGRTQAELARRDTQIDDRSRLGLTIQCTSYTSSGRRADKITCINNIMRSSQPTRTYARVWAWMGGGGACAKWCEHGCGLAGVWAESLCSRVSTAHRIRKWRPSGPHLFASRCVIHVHALHDQLGSSYGARNLANDITVASQGTCMRSPIQQLTCQSTG